MAIGIRAYIEFSTDSFATPSNCRAATPGGVFLWHDTWILNLLGIAQQGGFADHPIGFRGLPRCLSMSLVRDNYLFIAPDAPLALKEKKALRRFSSEDESRWVSEGLQIHPIENHDIYEIGMRGDDRLVLNPGCELPSWATGGELRTLVAGRKDEFEQGQDQDQHSRQYNLSVLNWVEELTAIYGDQGVRLIYWFSSIPRATLIRHR